MHLVDSSVSLPIVTSFFIMVHIVPHYRLFYVKGWCQSLYKQSWNDCLCTWTKCIVGANQWWILLMVSVNVPSPYPYFIPLRLFCLFLLTTTNSNNLINWKCIDLNGSQIDIHVYIHDCSSFFLIKVPYSAVSPSFLMSKDNWDKFPVRLVTTYSIFD